MKKEGGPPEDKGAETPAWIVSFADMTTLLLAFFVLLQSFAKDQNPELFYKGQGAFRRAIAGMGIPNLIFGKERKIEGPTRKKRHPTKKSKDKSKQRLIDPDGDEIRRIFQQLKQQVRTETDDVQTRQINVISTPVGFEQGEAKLNARAKKYLRDLAVNLKQNIDKDAIKIYIVGSASDMQGGREQWFCSTLRAKTVADFLTKALSSETDKRSWKLVAWGAGSKKTRRLRDDASGKREFIRIAIVEME